jgi:MoxR-like ATPase
MSAEEIIAFQRLVKQVPVADTVTRYAVRLASASRPNTPAAPDFINKWVTWGASLRASQFLVLGEKHARFCAVATTSRVNIRAVAPAVLRHRVLNFRRSRQGLF